MLSLVIKIHHPLVKSGDIFLVEKVGFVSEEMIVHIIFPSL